MMLPKKQLVLKKVKAGKLIKEDRNANPTQGEVLSAVKQLTAENGGNHVFISHVADRLGAQPQAIKYHLVQLKHQENSPLSFISAMKPRGSIVPGATSQESKDYLTSLLPMGDTAYHKVRYNGPLGEEMKIPNFIDFLDEGFDDIDDKFNKKKPDDPWDAQAQKSGITPGLGNRTPAPQQNQPAPPQSPIPDPNKDEVDEHGNPPSLDKDHPFVRNLQHNPGYIYQGKIITKDEYGYPDEEDGIWSHSPERAYEETKRYMRKPGKIIIGRIDPIEHIENTGGDSADTGNHEWVDGHGNPYNED